MKVHLGDTFAEVYKDSLYDLYHNSQFETNPRGLKIKENLNVSLIINNPVSSLYSNDRRSSQFKYIAAELLWYFLGRNDVNFIREYASFWEQIQNEDGTVNSSYGNLLFNKKNRYGINQYEWAASSLINDNDSRQAIMHFNMPEHQYNGNKDFVCTMYGIFHIRNNKLDLTINMRSNDAILGTATDVAFFTVLQQQMFNHLLRNMPNLKLGKYTHVINSYHIYERHFDLVKDMLDTEFSPVSFPTLDVNLICEDGSPTVKLSSLGANYKNKILISNDPLYTWIQNNINK